MFSMNRQWFTALLLRVFRHVDAAPIQNVPFISPANASVQQHEPAWQSGPGSRGTLSLVFSCVITLFFCIWTTVHVNIEPSNEINYTLGRLLGSSLPCLKDRKLGKFLAKSWVRKLGWGCVTLIVPEGVMAIATYETSTARILRDKINKAKRKIGDTDEWDMSLAYYSVMGGFTISEKAYDDAQGGSVSSDENKPLTLTPFGVLHVAQWECAGAASAGDRERMLLAVASEEVRDKGNANWVAKAIVFWQALWMIIQVCGRAAAKLPVTLLELHTVLHTFCAVAMYVTWWDKPVDIATPTVLSLRSDLVKQLKEGTKDPDPTDPLTTGQEKANTVDIGTPTIPCPDNDLVKQQREGTKDPDPTDPLTTGQEKAITVDIGTPTILCPDNDLVKQQREGTREPLPTDPLPTKQTEPNEVDKRAYLTSRAGLGKILFYSLCGNEGSSYFRRLTNAYTRLQRGWGNIWKQGFLISLVGLVYGGVHLTSWNSAFPSHSEEVLWQMAAAMTAAACSMFALSLWLNRGTSELYALVFALSAIPCVLARLYLLVESFASLRQLPLGAYEIPRWANLWPHAS